MDKIDRYFLLSISSPATINPKKMNEVIIEAGMVTQPNVFQICKGKARL
jgi:hypothetical protein